MFKTSIGFWALGAPNPGLEGAGNYLGADTGPYYTVPLCKSKLFIKRFCPILVLTTILCRLHHADASSRFPHHTGVGRGYIGIGSSSEKAPRCCND